MVKLKYPGVKTLLAVGGWALGTRQMHNMLKTAKSRAFFAKTSLTFLIRNGFDGLDLHFEYPGSRGSPRTDKRKYTLLVWVSAAFTVH